MEPELLLQQAQEAILKGADPAAVNQRLAELTEGRFRSVTDLRAAVSEDSRPRSLRERFAENRKSRMSLSDTLRMVAQGATFGFADEIAGALGGDTEESRERVERIRQEHPVGSLLSEGVGGAWVPGGVGVGVGRKVVARTGSRLLGGAGGAAAGGAAGGAVAGAGETEGGLLDRVGGAATGAGVGGVAGGLLGTAGAVGARAATRANGADIARHRINEALGAAGIGPNDVAAHVRELGKGSVVADLGENLGREARAAVNNAPTLAAPGGPKDAIRRRAASTGDRLASELRTATGLTRTFDESLEAANEGVRAVRRDFYRPLEESYPQIEGENIAAALSDPRIAAVAERVGVSLDTPPSFTQLQDVMMELRDEMTAARAAGRPERSRKAAEAFGALTDAMARDIPEFPAAQQAFRVASRTVDAHELGRKFARKPPREIRRQIGQLPEESRDAFRQGLLDVWETGLLERQGGGAPANRIIDAGDAMRERLRTLARDDESFARLLESGAREGRWRSTQRALSGNSTTAQQLEDSGSIFTRLPADKQGLFRSLIMWVQGPEQERRAAWELIGRTLLSDGEEAARLLTNELALRTPASAVAGAVGGSTAASQIR